MQHVRDFCARFNEGIRVEYKRNFDQNVRADLPKVVSSFANSQGGVIVAGVNTLRGTPQAPFVGFAEPRRDELPLTVENICLRNIHPPVLPRTTVVPSDDAGQTFLIIEVEESGEAPHAIENSKKVYVRTGNAANPYDLADVDLVMDLVKRRREPLELRDRLVKQAEERSSLSVMHGASFGQITISPRYPRNPLCSTQQIWEFLNATRYRGGSFFPQDSFRRVPDGVGASVPARAPRTSNEYGELNRYGLVMARAQLNSVPWQYSSENVQVLPFSDLFHLLFRLLICADRFYNAFGYRGTLLVHASLSNVGNRAMPFIPSGAFNSRPSDDFRCYANAVSAERIAELEEIGSQSLTVFIEIISELTWAFWQSVEDFPADQLRSYAQDIIHRMGRL